MNESRRKLLSMGAATIITGGLPLTATVLGAEAKPLTTAGLAKLLLTLADRAEGQGMRNEAQAIYQAVRVVLKGTPVGQPDGKLRAVVPCSTDSDCDRKNPGLRNGGMQ